MLRRVLAASATVARYTSEYRMRVVRLHCPFLIGIEEVFSWLPEP
jgi:hypothetical protein